MSQTRACFICGKREQTYFMSEVNLNRSNWSSGHNLYDLCHECADSLERHIENEKKVRESISKAGQTTMPPTRLL